MALFAPTNPAKIEQEQLYEARRELLTHTAAAEYHQAIADMYRKRIDRLTISVNTPKPLEPLA